MSALFFHSFIQPTIILLIEMKGTYHSVHHVQVSGF